MKLTNAKRILIFVVAMFSMGTLFGCAGMEINKEPMKYPYLLIHKDLQESDQNKFGPGDYRPNLFVTYWAFRAMIGLLAVPALFAVAALWLTRGGRIPKARWLSWFALATLPTPFLANSAGWVFTEMGRQPWVVVPNLTGDPMIRLNVANGVSGHSAAMVVASLVTFTLVYAVLAVIWFWLIRRYVVEGAQEHDSEPAAPTPPGDDEVAPLSFAY